MDNIERFVDFSKYCPECKYKDVKGHKDPCNDCLECPVNTESEKPIHYEEKDEKEK